MRDKPGIKALANTPMLQERGILSTPYLISSGNWAFVTRKLEMPRWCRSLTNWLICGYMMGSPTSDRAQCFTVIASSRRAAFTPDTPGKRQNRLQPTDLPSLQHASIPEIRPGTRESQQSQLEPSGTRGNAKLWAVPTESALGASTAQGRFRHPQSSGCPATPASSSGHPVTPASSFLAAC